MSSMDQLSHFSQPQKELRNVLQGYLGTLAALIPLLVIYWSFNPALLSLNWLDTLNASLPIYFIVVLLHLAWRTMGVMPSAIWTGLIWYPLHSAVFFGFGPLVDIYGNEVTRTIMSGHFLGINEQELFRAHKLSVTGISMGLLGLALHMILRGAVWTPSTRAAGPVFNTMKIGISFLVFGATFKYLLLKPAQWGMIHVTVPGALSALSNLTDLGFAIIAYSAARGRRSVLTLLWIGLPLHLLLCLLSMAKTEVLIALLLPAIGHFLGSGNKGKLLRHIVVMVVIFTVLQPFVHYGRGVIADRTGSISLASYGERMEILESYIMSSSIRTPEEPGEERQGWWTRLNYSGPQARAMELYDRGFSNTSLRTAWVYFVPRALWPDKPIIVGPGRDFYRLLSGREDASSLLGLSIYGDFYWQFGWAGLIIGCLLFGWLLGITASRALRAVLAQEFIMLPFIMMALNLAVSSPGKYVLNGIIGQLPIMVFYYAMISGLLWLLRDRTTSRGRPVDN